MLEMAGQTYSVNHRFAHIHAVAGMVVGAPADTSAVVVHIEAVEHTEVGEHIAVEVQIAVEADMLDSALVADME